MNFLDCPYLHSPLDYYCNLFKCYRNCQHKKCEVLESVERVLNNLAFEDEIREHEMFKLQCENYDFEYGDVKY